MYQINPQIFNEILTRRYEYTMSQYGGNIITKKINEIAYYLIVFN